MRDRDNPTGVKMDTITAAMASIVIMNVQKTYPIYAAGVTNGETVSRIASVAAINSRIGIHTGAIAGTNASVKITNSKIPGTNVTGTAAVCTGPITNDPVATTIQPIKPNKYEENSKKASTVFANEETETFTFPFKASFLAGLRKIKRELTIFYYVTN